MKLHFENHVVAGLFLTVIVLIFLGWYSFSSIQNLLQTAKMLSHSSRVVNSAEQLMKACVDIETGQHGYVITGDTIFLEHSEGAKNLLPLRLNTLDSLAATSLPQQSRIKELRTLVNNQLGYVQKVIEARTKNFEAARELVASGEGKRTTDVMRKLIIEIQDDERATFRKNNTVTSKSLRQFQSSFIGLVVTVTGIIIYLFYSLNKSFGVRYEIEKKLQKTARETRKLYDDAPCGYLSVDASIYISNINKTLLDWLGYQQEEVIGKMKYEDLLSPESRQIFLISFQEDFDKYKTNGFVSDLEFEFLRKDGTIFPVVVNSSAVFNEAGEFESSITTVFDNTVRKKAEEQIAYLARLVEDSSEGVYSVTVDFHIRTWNKGAETLYGFTAAEAIGKPVFEIIRSHMSVDKRLHIREQILHDGHWEGELEHIRKDGTAIYVLSSATATRNKQGEIQGYVSVSRDITDRKNAENALYKLNEELEQRVIERTEVVEETLKEKNIILESIGDAFFAVNKEWIVTYWNRIAEMALGVKKQEIVGENLWKIFSSSIDSESYKRYHQAISTNTVLHFEDHYQPLDKWYEISAYPSANGLSVYFKDVTERKKTEEKLLASENQYRRLFEAAKDGILILNADTGFIEDVNPFLVEMLGYSHDELLGKELWEISLFKDIVANRDSFTKLQQQRYVRYENLPLETKRGKTLWVEFISNAYDVGGKQIMQCNIRDITERKLAEEKIKLLNETLEGKVEERTEQLKAVNKELEAFSYSVSHDLRAPLRSIAGYSQILKEDYSEKLDTEGQRITDVVIKNAKRMGMLIDDLLDFTRLGRKEMMMRKVNMRDVIDDVLAQLMVNENGRKLSIKNLVQLSTEADATMIYHVWTNLISNALKYTSKKEVTEIEIGSFEEFDSICYYVRDNGAGFDMLYVNKLFGVFQRLHKMNEFEGTGVGLALVKTIVERHGGKVWAVGKLNEGATFYFSLPKEQVENTTTKA